MLTQEDKQLIADYMGWPKISSDDVYGREIEGSEDQLCVIRYNLNDAGLCVEKMSNTPQEIDFKNFINIAITTWNKTKARQSFDSWLFNADNFFSAMAAWLRERKEK